MRLMVFNAAGVQHSAEHTTISHTYRGTSSPQADLTSGVAAWAHRQFDSACFQCARTAGRIAAIMDDSVRHPVV